MDWVTAIWAMLIGGCVAIALPQFLVGIWQRRGAHLFFVLAAAAVIGIAICEILMMRSGTVDQFARAQQWTHVPIFILVVALVGFVRLYFHTGRLWLRRKVQVATGRNGNGSIQVSVRDYGTGIPDQIRERLFEQFFTTKEEGLGMGLAITRSIIEAHAGTIGVKNVEGGGARFYFTLPVTETSSQ
jgi:hypothetical protein